MPWQRAKELRKQLDDMDYTEQQALINLHILPAEYEAQDFFRMNEVLSALPPDKRVQDPADLIESLGFGTEHKI